MISLNPGFLLKRKHHDTVATFFVVHVNSWRVGFKKTVKDFTSFDVADKNRWIGCVTNKKSVLKV